MRYTTRAFCSGRSLRPFQRSEDAVPDIEELLTPCGRTILGIGLMTFAND